MTDNAARNYHTIGEVLNLLKVDFPDVSISKIRFLESQGLLNPERTPSGYRKFQAVDVERLRFILREQRDHYLPLKVIRERLALWERGELDPDAPVPEAEAPRAAAADDGMASLRGFAPVEAAVPPRASADGERFDQRALASASGCTEQVLAELERYGIIVPVPSAAGDPPRYDELALLIARIAKAFTRFGVEPRHLRMFRQSADREMALFEQVVSPMLSQRSPQARRDAVDSLADLTSLARKLHHSLLAQSLQSYEARVE